MAVEIKVASVSSDKFELCFSLSLSTRTLPDEPVSGDEPRQRIPDHGHEERLERRVAEPADVGEADLAVVQQGPPPPPRLHPLAIVMFLRDEFSHKINLLLRFYKINNLMSSCLGNSPCLGSRIISF